MDDCSGTDHRRRSRSGERDLTLDTAGLHNESFDKNADTGNRHAILGAVERAPGAGPTAITERDQTQVGISVVELGERRGVDVALVAADGVSAVVDRAKLDGERLSGSGGCAIADLGEG